MDPFEEIPVILGPGSRFEGLLTYRGSARVEGTLEGEVVAEGCLVVGAGGRVLATIEVDELVVEGEVAGDVLARSRLEVASTGRIQGSVTTPRLAVAEGGLIQARCTTGARVDERAPGAPGVAESG